MSNRNHGIGTAAEAGKGQLRNEECALHLAELHCH